MPVRQVVVGGLLVVGVFLVCPHAFVAPGNVAPTEPQRAATRGSAALFGSPEVQPVEDATNSNTMASLLLGTCLGVCVVLSGAKNASALDLSEAPLPLDGSGKTVIMTPEQLVRGKRLFNAACGSCHGGGSTKTNQTVSLDTEALKGAVPPRDNINSLVEYLKKPMTYDGVTDIAELHPSTTAGDIWPKMRSMKEKDLVDMGTYIMYMNSTVLEKWGGGKMYF